MMGAISSLFFHQKAVAVVPRDLKELLDAHNRAIWLPPFREYLSGLDGKAGRQRPFRENLLDFVLTCIDIFQLQEREMIARDPRRSAELDEHQSPPNHELENICNERDVKFDDFYERFFQDTSKHKIALSDSTIWRRIRQIMSKRKSRQRLNGSHFERRDDFYELVHKAYDDVKVWQELERLCNQFLKKAKVPAMAVLLSIL